jgi:hypothetical protein
MVTPSDGVRSGGFVAAAIPGDDRGPLKERFFADVLPYETITVAVSNAIACEHDDFLAAIRESRPPLVTAAAGAAAVEIAARINEAPVQLGSTYRSGGPAAAIVRVEPFPLAAALLPRTVEWSYRISPHGIEPLPGARLASGASASA